METPKEDIVKLHNEVNQLMNQRFLLTTTAITIFGVFSASMIPRISVQTQDLIKSCDILIAGAIFILLFFSLLFYWNRKVLILHWTIIAYMQINNLSKWEKDIGVYFSKNRDGLSTQTTVFVLLGLFSILWPIVIFYSLNISLLNQKTGLLAVIFFIYLITILIIYKTSKPYKKITKTWDEVLK